MLNIFGNNKGRRSATIKQNATVAGIKRDARSVNLSSSAAYELLNYEYKGKDVLASIKSPSLIGNTLNAAISEGNDIIELDGTEYYAYSSDTFTQIRRIVNGVDSIVTAFSDNRKIEFTSYGKFVYYTSGLGNEKVSVIYNNGQFLRVDDATNYAVNFTVENGTGGAAIVDYVDTDTNTLVIQPPFTGSFSTGDSISQPAVPSTSTTTLSGEENIYELLNAPSADHIETLTLNGDSRVVVFNTDAYGNGSSLRSHTDKNYGIPFTDWSFTRGSEALDEGGLTVSSDLKKVVSSDMYGGNIYQFNENGFVVWGLGIRDEYGIGALQDVKEIHEEKNTDVFHASVATKDGIYYASDDGIYTVRMGSPVQHINISESIGNLLDLISFDNASMCVHDKKLYIACNRGEYIYNNYVLIYDLEYKRWTSMSGFYDTLYSNGKNMYGIDLYNNRFVKFFAGTEYNPTLIIFKEEDLGLPRSSKSLRQIHTEMLIQDGEVAELLLDVWGDDNTKVNNYVVDSFTGYDDSVAGTYDTIINSKPIRKSQIEIDHNNTAYNEFHYLEVDFEVYDKIYKNNL